MEHTGTLNLGKTSLYVYSSVPHDKVTLTVRIVELCNFKEIIQNYIRQRQ